MNGKSKCKILKEIRRQIAENNDIEFVTSECKYQGDCLGTCPKCEQEVRYLEAELLKRKQLGKNIAVAGLAAAMVASSIGCGNNPAGNESSSAVIDSSSTTTESTTTEAGSTVSTVSSELIQGEMIIPEIDSNDMDFSSEFMSDIDLTSNEYSMGATPQEYYPDIEDFLNLDESQYLGYISRFSRRELQSAWKDKLATTGNPDYDVYMIFDSATKRLSIKYDSNNLAVSVEVIENYNSHISESSFDNYNSSVYVTMGTPPPMDIPSKPDENEAKAELVFSKKPDVEYFKEIYEKYYSTDPLCLNRYIFHYSRNQVRKAWKEYRIETNNKNVDVYDIFNSEHKVIIKYTTPKACVVKNYKTPDKPSSSTSSSITSSVTSSKISSLNVSSASISTNVSSVASSEGSVPSEIVSNSESISSQVTSTEQVSDISSVTSTEQVSDISSVTSDETSESNYEQE